MRRRGDAGRYKRRHAAGAAQVGASPGAIAAFYVADLQAPLLRTLEDPVEKNRELAIALVCTLLSSVRHAVMFPPSCPAARAHDVLRVCVPTRVRRRMSRALCAARRWPRRCSPPSLRAWAWCRSRSPRRSFASPCYPFCARCSRITAARAAGRRTRRRSSRCSPRPAATRSRRPSLRPRGRWARWCASPRRPRRCTRRSGRCCGRRSRTWRTSTRASGSRRCGRWRRRCRLRRRDSRSSWGSSCCRRCAALRTTTRAACAR